MPTIDQLSGEGFQSKIMTTFDTTKPLGIRHKTEGDTDVPEVIKRFEFDSESESDSNTDNEGDVSQKNLHTINQKCRIKCGRNKPDTSILDSSI